MVILAVPGLLSCPRSSLLSHVILAVVCLQLTPPCRMTLKLQLHFVLAWALLRSKVDQVQDIVTGNPTVIKMVVSFNRGARGQNTLRQLLAPVVKEIIEDKALIINTNPVEVYKAWVNQLETQTGEAR